MPNKGSTASNKKNKRTRQRPKKPASIATAVVSHVNDNGQAILEIDGQQKPFKLSKRQSNKFQLEENNRLIVIFKPVKHGLEVIVSEKSVLKTCLNKLMMIIVFLIFHRYFLNFYLQHILHKI